MLNPRIAKVIKAGNSLAVIIPVEILRSLKIERGDAVIFSVYDENIFAVRRIPQEELRSMQPKDLQF